MNKKLQTRKILVMEEHTSLNETLVELLTLENFKVYHSEHGQVGLQIAKKHLPNIIICSRMFADTNCWDVFQALQRPYVCKIKSLQGKKR